MFKDIPFPCSLNNTRSKNKPTSVHKLKPGDIDVVGGIGDSLTAGFGSNALNPLQIFIESRGKSWSIGKHRKQTCDGTINCICTCQYKNN